MTEEEKILAVARHNRQASTAASERFDQAILMADTAVGESKKIIERNAKALEISGENRETLSPGPLVVSSFDELVREAEELNPSVATIDDLLSEEEILQVGGRLEIMREDFRSLHRMDAMDYAIAGTAGLLGAIVDVFLIQIPKAPGFLGSAGSTGGPLGNWIRERVNSSMSPDQVSWLEREFTVPYDAPTSANLANKIAGLSPRTHRFHSLGHDPLLSWIFGIGDLMQSKMSTIDKNGMFLSQSIGSPADLGMDLFASIYRMLGHLLSDVTTKAGLPAPLTSLLLLARDKLALLGDRSPGEIARSMYARNYDFRHFLTMSITPLLIESIVRIGYLWKEIAAGKSLSEALPIQVPMGERKPRLHSMLFTAHAIAAAANAGKIAVQGGLTPVGLLALNYPQWLALARYSVSQAVWLAYSKPKAEIGRVQDVLDDEWDLVFEETNRQFRESTKPAFLINA